MRQLFSYLTEALVVIAKTLLVVGTGLVLVLCVYSFVIYKDPVPVMCEMGQTKNNQKYVIRWTEKEIHFNVYNMPEEFRSEIDPAIAFWQQNYPYLKITYSFSDRTLESPPGSENFIVWKSTWEPEFYKQQGRTSISHYEMGDKYIRISRAGIRINSKDFKFSKTPEPNRVHFQSLLVHELGHALGLAHSQFGVMQPKLEDNTVRLKLSESEKIDLQCLISASDLTETTVKASVKY